jgi:hypothetical protein
MGCEANYGTLTDLPGGTLAVTEDLACFFRFSDPAAR